MSVARACITANRGPKRCDDIFSALNFAFFNFHTVTCTQKSALLKSILHAGSIALVLLPSNTVFGGVGHCFAWHVQVNPVFSFNFTAIFIKDGSTHGISFN